VNFMEPPGLKDTEKRRVWPWPRRRLKRFNRER
jgi:hypothetical protein